MSPLTGSGKLLFCGSVDPCSSEMPPRSLKECNLVNNTGINYLVGVTYE